MIHYNPGTYLDGDAPCVLCGDPDVVFADVARVSPDGIVWLYQLCADCREIPGVDHVVKGVLCKLWVRRSL
jgi:hypothetical protein